MSAVNNTAWNLPHFGIPNGLLCDTPQNSWADSKSSGIDWASDSRSRCSSGAHSADCSFPIIPMMLRMWTNLPSRSPPRAGHRISTVRSWWFRLKCSYMEAVRNSCLSERETLRCKVKAPCGLQMSDISWRQSGKSRCVREFLISVLDGLRITFHPHRLFSQGRMSAIH